MYDADLEPAKVREVVRSTAEGAGPAPMSDVAMAPLGRGAASDHASLLRLQRTVGNAGVVQMLTEEALEAPEAADTPSPVHDVVGSGGGTPLDSSTRSSMESRFGESFDDVKVHTDDRASASAEAVGANAYTVGSDIVFRAGQFDASSSSGQKTIAHELAHVVQQRSGPVDGSDAPGGIRVSDPGDRFEQAAEATAGQVMSPSASASTSSSAAPTAQLEAEDDDGAFAVQREIGDEENDEEEDQVG